VALDESDRLPVIVASAQVVGRDGEPAGALELAARAARTALDDAPALAARIDQLSVVSILTAGGAGNAPASTLAAQLGLRPGIRTETTTIGGNTPQWLLTRAAAAIAAGELDAALIMGGEAMRSARQTKGRTAPGPMTATPDPVVGDDRFGSSPEELAIGLVLPTHVYAMLESVVAHRAGRDPAAQRRWIAGWLAPFTEVAAKHPHAWFPQARPATELAEPGPDNRIVAEPYPKRMSAVLEVDQAAAIVVCSLGAARAAGVADRAVFVWSGASATDVFHVSARPDLASSPGIAAAAGGALAAAAIDVDALEQIDLYSCFPVAVEVAADALGLALDDARGLTVTGGLPYFGGPGNNYGTHAIATLADLLRDGDGLGLTTGLGWFVTKHAASVLGRQPPPYGFRLGDTTAAQAAIDASALPVAAEGDGPAVVDAATVAYTPDGAPVAAPAIATLADGRRMALAPADGVLQELAGTNLIATTVQVAGNRYRV
jgi:acetyl-CoA C-acetyltransferase